MKMCLFSTPHQEGTDHVALDTQREINHKDVMKAFRPRSTVETVVQTMTVVDHFTDVINVRSRLM
ncbi:hypothetical protein DPMN_135216 [Dreissena polymorpha]|uniref:Uncharacterized protein n=1 Tax=Dreissena polymorpha TaxID=45954 RepID=A0A9D4FXP9_DREPO|nr:hypothetical protein DPMN_135216 [Dreissena polymorpha]